MSYTEHWPRYILKLIIASHGTNIPGMKFLHQIVFQLLGKITERWNIDHTESHWPRYIFISATGHMEVKI